MTDEPWRLVFTRSAVEHAAQLDSWWRQHRQAAPSRFVRELASGLELLLRFPWIGAPYAKGTTRVRRLLLRRVHVHLYYGVDAAARAIRVYAVWHASRREPRGL